MDTFADKVGKMSKGELLQEGTYQFFNLITTLQIGTVAPMLAGASASEVAAIVQLSENLGLIFQQEAELAEHFFEKHHLLEGYHQVLTPIKTVVLDGVEVTAVSLGCGRESAKRVIEILKKNSKIVRKKGLVDTAKRVAEKVGKKISGSLIIEKGGKFSVSEIRAAKYMRDRGNKVVLRVPRGTRVGGGTSDLLVNGVNYDVYTPITKNHNRIITAIADKKTQAIGIVLDLSQTTVTAKQLGDVMARLAGKGVKSIKEVVILKK